MNQPAIKRIVLFLGCIMMMTMFKAVAQDVDNNHFIYIQAKAKQPFYVILNKKVYSSSSIGYLIIPKLKDGSYAIRIGFPKEQAPELNFTCEVKNEDAGYSLEKGDDGNLGLLNLQSRSFIAANSVTTLEDQYAAGAGKTTAKETPAAVVDNTPAQPSAFSAMLSDVANDSSLNRPVEQPKATLAPKEGNLSTQVADFGKNPLADSKAVAKASSENLRPADVAGDFSKTYGVIKSAQQHTNAGTQMTFVLFNSQSTDTVDALIPVQNQTDQSSSAVVDQGQTPKVTSADKNSSLALFSNTEGDNFNTDSNSTGVSGEDRRTRRKSKKFVNIDSNQDSAAVGEGQQNKVNNPFYKKSEDVQSATSEDVASPAISNQTETVATTPCENPLSDKDFAKMQKRMIAHSNDNEMLAIVDKYIKNKCVTTEQIKQLGGLFLSDAGRFGLYHDAYPNVSDKNNFPSLKGQLLDSYFKKRFETLLQ